MSVHDERAVRGALLLDERLPGWRGMIDPDTLRLQWCSQCILGQLFSDYDRGVRALGLTNAEAIEYGFYVTGPSKAGMWERLTRAWLRVLR